MKKQALNPYMGSAEHVPDGEPHVFGDRLYVYGSHDQFGGKDFCLLDYVGWSAPLSDLSDWRYEGVIYQAAKDPLYTPERRLFAPDTVRGADGRYYLYYGFDQTGTLGVAVCDEPAGEYEFYGHISWADGTLLGKKAEDMFQYDPAVLVDEDGRVYLYSGFCFNADRIPKFRSLKSNREGAMVIELEQDMKTVKEAPKYIVPSEFNSQGTGYEGHAFFEASSIRRFGDRYYFVYSSEQGHELCYAISDRPDSGFSYGGTIISNGDLGYRGNTKSLNYTGTNHGGLVEIGGNYYIFWHRQFGGSAYGRQGCAEQVFPDETGHIAQVPMSSCGLNGGPLAGKGKYEAGIACCLMSGQGAGPYIPLRRVDALHPYLTHDGGDFDPASGEKMPAAYITNMRDEASCAFRFFDLSETTTIAIEAAATADDKTDAPLDEVPEGRLLISEGSGQVFAILNISGLQKEDKEHVVFSSAIDCKKEKAELWITYQGKGAVDIHTIELK